MARKKNLKGLDSITKQFMSPKEETAGTEERSLPIAEETKTVKVTTSAEVKKSEETVKNSKGAGRPKKVNAAELLPISFRLEAQHIETFTESRFARRKKTDVEYLRWLIEEDAKRLARGE